MRISTKKLARSASVGALYIILSMLCFPIASNAIQFRLSESLTLLPLFFPETVAGLFIGCLITDLITGCVVWDIVFGSLITLVAGLFTAIVGKFIKKLGVKIIVGGLFPVLLNAFLLPVIWYYVYGKLEYVYIIQVLFLLLGQVVSVYIVGTPLMIAVGKLKDSGNRFLE